MNPWWSLFFIGLGIILCKIDYAFSLTKRRPDLEIDESEEFSGVIDVRQNIKAQHDIDIAGRMCDDFDNGSDGA